MVHHDDAIGHFQRLLLVVRDEHAGHMHFVVETPQPAAQLLPNPRVERAERLVQQQHARLDGERARKRDPLPLAAGELVRIAVGEPVELHQLEQRHHLLRGSPPSGGRCARGRTRRPNATFSKIVMWPNSA